MLKSAQVKATAQAKATVQAGLNAVLPYLWITMLGVLGAGIGYGAGVLSDGAKGTKGTNSLALGTLRPRTSGTSTPQAKRRGTVSKQAARQAATVAGAKPVADPAVKQRLARSYGRIPLSFEANKGQTAKPVKFLSRGSGYTLFLTPTEAVFTLSRSEKPIQRPEIRPAAAPGTSPVTAPAKAGSKATASSGLGTAFSRLTSSLFSALSPQATAPKTPPQPKTNSKFKTQNSKLKTAVLRMKLLGANANPQVSGQDKQPGISNYFIGNDKKKWRTKIANYGKVRYEEVYPGIDLVYYGNQQQLEYDFIVAPGADPKDIRLSFSGAKKVSINKQGELVLDTGSGQVVQKAPFIYQKINGKRKQIAGRYVLKAIKNSKFKIQNYEVGFEVGSYDRSRPLVIDPVLAYSTYLGGDGLDSGSAIAVDNAGNAYVTGWSLGPGQFPTTPGAYDGDQGGREDIFVTKLNATGTSLIYSTYLGGYSTYFGGNSSGDLAYSIAIDGDGNAYVTGYTHSTDFPTTAGVVQPAKAEPTSRIHPDVFVTKLNAAGSDIIYSTYLGGSNIDIGSSIGVDSAGNAYVTGHAQSNFPTTAGSIPTTNQPGAIDAFVTKLNPTGTALVYSTFLGGWNQDGANAIAVDDAGNAYVTGRTWSTDFPTTPGAFQTSYVGRINDDKVFVTKLNATGTALVYSTYLDLLPLNHLIFK